MNVSPFQNNTSWLGEIVRNIPIKELMQGLRVGQQFETSGSTFMSTVYQKCVQNNGKMQGFIIALFVIAKDQLVCDKVSKLLYIMQCTTILKTMRRSMFNRIY